MLFSLGISPQQRALLGGGAPLNGVLYRRLLRLIDGQPNDDNYFAWQALRNRVRIGPVRNLRRLPLLRTTLVLIHRFAAFA